MRRMLQPASPPAGALNSLEAAFAAVRPGA
jgi:hypothetical protein